MPAKIVQKNRKPFRKLKVDSVTIDIIESALRNARFEMDTVLFRTAMSPGIREQHDEFPLIANLEGKMVVGQFGSFIHGFIAAYDGTIEEGDVFLTTDPYACQGAISHANDWLVLLPIFYKGELVGWGSQFGHTIDMGGPVSGSLPTDATTIFGEGTRIPPVKLFAAGKLNEDLLDTILNNSRVPTMNYFDLMAIVAACRTAEKRVVEMCDRFGKDVLLDAYDVLLDRTHKAMSQLIQMILPEKPASFEDFIDDDGRGNGPYKMKLTMWREGDHAYFDWTGTDPQAPGPINFFLNEEMFKMFIGVYLIMVFDPQILFNDGFYPLLHITMPQGTLIQPNFPAALGCRTHALTRLFDVLGGCLGVNAPELSTAAGYGTSPYLLYNGYDENGEFFHLMEITYGGIPGRPIGDGMDAHSWWPLFENIPTEYLESYYPLTVLEYGSLADSGGGAAASKRAARKAVSADKPAAVAPAKAAAKPASAPATAKSAPLDTQLAAAVARLVKLEAGRPRTLKTLRSSLKSWFKPVLSDAAVTALLDTLCRDGKIHVEGSKVSYTL